MNHFNLALCIVLGSVASCLAAPNYYGFNPYYGYPFNNGYQQPSFWQNYNQYQPQALSAVSNNLIQKASAAPVQSLPVAPAAPAPVVAAPAPAVTQSFSLGKRSVGPSAQAALAYFQNMEGDDICGTAAKAYLDSVLSGGSTDAALESAKQKYRTEYAKGSRAAPGSSCAASEHAWKGAEAQGVNPVDAAARAFMDSWPGVALGNPCALAGRDYAHAVIQGSSEIDANLRAARTFSSAMQSLAAAGKELRDPACAAAARAYYNSLPNKPSPANGAAMLAFMDKAMSGFSFDFDPVCWRSAQAFFDASAAGKSEVNSALSAAETFLEAFAAGGDNIPADSPCAAAAKAYFANIPNPPAPQVKVAAEAFMNSMISGGRRQPDPVCANAAKAYWTAYKSGVKGNDATLAAAQSFIQSYRSGKSIPANSPCLAAAIAYNSNLVGKPSSPNAEAMMAFVNTMIAKGNQPRFDPACADASLAYFNSYKAGDDELTSNFRAARAFISQYKKNGAKVPADSPCLAAAKIYSHNIRNKPSQSNAAAMLAFMNEAVLQNTGRADNVCLVAAEAYFDAFIAGHSEAKATEMAGSAFLEAVAQKPNFSQSSPCGKAAKAFMGSLDL